VCAFFLCQVEAVIKNVVSAFRLKMDTGSLRGMGELVLPFFLDDPDFLYPCCIVPMLKLSWVLCLIAGKQLNDAHMPWCYIGYYRREMSRVL